MLPLTDRVEFRAFELRMRDLDAHRDLYCDRCGEPLRFCDCEDEA